MKYWLLLLAIAASAAVYFGFNSFRKHEFPVTRSVTNFEGTRIKIEATSRTSTHLRGRRLSDSTAFEYPLAKLSMEDQKYFRKFPATSPPPPPPPPEPPGYVKSRNDQISRIEKQIEILKIDVDADTLPAGLENHYRERIATLQKEVRDLKAEIEIYELDRKSR